MLPGRESNPKKQFKVCRFNRLNYRGCCSSFRAVMPEFEEYEALFWTNIKNFLQFQAVKICFVTDL